MAAAKQWRRKRGAGAEAANKRAARAAARDYLTGRKVRRYESPKMIAQHGREPWPPAKAAREAYTRTRLNALVGDRYPTAELERHYKGKGTGRKKTSRGGTWTLRKANVSRAKDGTFKKRGR